MEQLTFEQALEKLKKLKDSDRVLLAINLEPIDFSRSPQQKRDVEKRRIFPSNQKVIIPANSRGVVMGRAEGICAKDGQLSILWPTIKILYHDAGCPLCPRLQQCSCVPEIKMESIRLNTSINSLRFTTIGKNMPCFKWRI
jgi:hypothetical protein